MVAEAGTSHVEVGGRSHGDKGVGLLCGLTGSFNKYLVRVYDVSGIIQWAAEPPGQNGDKKISPGVMGKLSGVIKTRLQQGGTTGSE